MSELISRFCYADLICAMDATPLQIAALVGCLTLGTGVARAQVHLLTAAEQADIQQSVHRLVQSVNDGNLEGVLQSTISRFDAMMPGEYVNLDRLKKTLANRPGDLRKLELATLIRAVRLLTPDVAFADGFFRTIHLPGGESAGRLSLTLLKQEGKWLVAAARFAPYNFNGSRFFAADALARTPPDEDGWVTLFDGKSTDAFVRAGDGGPFPDSWTIEDGTLKAVVKPGTNFGLRTRDAFRSFELRFSWRLPPKGNSGIKYRLFYLIQRDGTGHEYQVVDDAGDPGAIEHPEERAGALYNQIAPSKAAARPIGEFNDSVLIVRGRHCEHWLNGQKVVEYETESGPLEGPILLQHHATEAWFRNIRIRRLDDK